MRNLLFVALACSALACGQANAGEFSLAGDQRWIVYSTQDDLEHAIAFARRFASNDRKGMAMKQADGRFSVVAGPVAAPDPEKLIQDEAARWYPEPPPPTLSRGDEFTGKAWQPADPVIARGEMKEDAPQAATLAAGPLRIDISPRKGRKRDSTPTAVAIAKEGKPVFRHVFDDDDYRANAAAFVVRLAPGPGDDQVVFTHFTGGPHCCTNTIVATADAQGRWRAIDAGYTERGYDFEDLDGDGAAEMIGLDEGLLYAFSSYADSNPPPRLKKLVDGTVKDVTFDPAYRRYMRQQLYLMEGIARPQDWKRNGWLAGWVAMKIIVGEGPDGWSRMLANYDRDDSASIERCRVKAKVDECPSAKRKFIDAPFPAALRVYLVRHDYPVSDLPPAK